MRLVPVSSDYEELKRSAPLWKPFLAMVSRSTKESVPTLIDQVTHREVRMTLIWDDETNQPMALAGVRFHMRERDLIAEMCWMVGHNHKVWEHLLPEFEQMLRVSGAVECRISCRRGWANVLEANGYKLTHIQMEKCLG